MKRLLLAVLTAAVVTISATQATAQAVSAPAPITPGAGQKLTLRESFQGAIDALESGMSKWYVGGYGSYTPSIGDKWGGGAFAFYPLIKDDNSGDNYLLAGPRIDYTSGDWYSVSGTATLQLPLRPISRWKWLVVTPFIEGGIGTPISGTKKNGDPVAITGAGAALHVHSWNNNKVNFNLIAARENFGSLHRYLFGPEVTVSW